MATEWIDVVDTSVKIGLGALISGIATYKVSALNHKKDIEKTIINKKIDILEEISENAERYFYFCTSLSNAISGMQKNAKNIGGDLSDSQRKIISSKHTNMDEALESRNKAMSKIKILSIPEAENALFEYNTALSDLRNIIIFDKKMPSREEREAISARFQCQKDSFYQSISRYMDEVGT